jgi:hypothetical protein
MAGESRGVVRVCLIYLRTFSFMRDVGAIHMCIVVANCYMYMVFVLLVLCQYGVVSTSGPVPSCV